MRRPADRTILRYVKVLASELGLADWDIKVTTDPTMTSSWWAHCEVPQGKSFAHIKVSPSLFDEPVVEHRQVLIHELIHVHLFPLEWSWDSAIKELGPRARRVANEVWSERSERACDDLARLLASGLPLPPWGAR